jgi:hypothetical protein
LCSRICKNPGLQGACQQFGQPGVQASVSRPPIELFARTRSKSRRKLIHPGHEARSAAWTLLAYCLGEPIMPDRERIRIEIFLGDDLP